MSALPSTRRWYSRRNQATAGFGHGRRRRVSCTLSIERLEERTLLSFTPISSPNAAYTGSTNLLPIGVQDSSQIAQLSDSNETVGFSQNPPGGNTVTTQVQYVSSAATYNTGSSNSNQAISLPSGGWVQYSFTPWYDWENPNSPQVTIELWVNPQSYNVPILYMQWYNANSATVAGYILNMSIDPNGRLTIGGWNSVVYGSANTWNTPFPTGNTIIPLNTWTQVAFTWSPNGSSTYINGVQDAYSPSNYYPGLWSSLIPTEYIYLNGWGASAFGQMSGLQLSNVAVTQFSGNAQAATVPGSWATWSSPPQSENATPRVAFETGNNLTLTFSQPVTTFGAEAEPHVFGTFNMTATFYDGSNTVGTISMGVGGDAGAQLFAGSTDDQQFTSVTFTAPASADGFAIADVRYALSNLSSLMVTTQPPSTVVGGDPFEVDVQVDGPGGTPDPNYNGTVTLSLANNPGGATLAGTTTITINDGSGVADFGDLTLDQPGQGYTLQATGTGVSAVTTNSFDVTAVTAGNIVFDYNPGGFITALLLPVTLCR